MLKGCDPVTNIVLDEAEEFLRDANDTTKTTDKTRSLGLIVCRGPSVMSISPAADVIEMTEEEFMAQNQAAK